MSKDKIEYIRRIRRRVQLYTAMIAVVVSMAILSVYFVDFSTSFTDSFYLLTSGILASGIGASIAFYLAKLQKLVRNRKTIFISYTHQDSEFVDKLINDLSDLNIDFLIDRIELSVGDNIKSAVDNMIDRSDAILFIISPNFAQSSWAKKELEQAVKRDKKILPAVLDKEAIPEDLNGVFYADFSDNYNDGVNQLKRSLAK